LRIWGERRRKEQESVQRRRRDEKEEKELKTESEEREESITFEHGGRPGKSILSWLSRKMRGGRSWRG